jgi:chorismate mutase
MSKSKLNDIKVILTRDKYDVFTISETWLWHCIEDSEIEIDDYHVIRCDRPSVKTYKRGGGILAYVHKKYELTEMKHSFSSPEKVQAIKFSIDMKYLKPIIIISIYRVADTPTSFIKQLEAETLQSNDKEIFILGDLNIDQLCPNENQLKPLITSLGLHQLIKTPTRVTDKTKTLIDLIITNSPHCDAKNTGVIRCGLSDHDIVFAVRKVKNSHKPAFETREVRDFKNVDIHAVQKMIAKPHGGVSKCPRK